MQSLQKMTLLQPYLSRRNEVFTALQPQLTNLQLISCLQLSDCAMANIVQSLPALQRFAFQQESHTQPVSGLRSFTSAGLLMLNQASNRRTVNLEGAQGLWNERIYAFEADFRAEHDGEAGRCLVLQLPSRSGLETFCITPFDCTFLSVDAKLPNNTDRIGYVWAAQPSRKPGWDAHLSDRCNPSAHELILRPCGKRLTKTLGGTFHLLLCVTRDVKALCGRSGSVMRRVK